MKRAVFGLFLALLFLTVFGCSQRAAGPKDPAVMEADRLLHEADSLMRTDSAFYYSVTDRKTEREASKDLEIRAKLDSALDIAPGYGKAYTGKLIYLGQCYKFREVLPLLRQMDDSADAPMNADIRGMKAMLEDIMGDSVSARRDFLLADSSYAVLMARYGKDPLYIGYRFNRMVNLSLMENDFSILREDMERVKDYSSVEGIERYARFNNKDEYYRYLLPVLFTQDAAK